MNPRLALGGEREVGHSRPSCPQLMEQGGLDSQPSGARGLLWVVSPSATWQPPSCCLPGAPSRS